MDTPVTLARLQDLSAFLETGGTLEENLGELTGIAARTLDATRVSVMLLSEGEGTHLKLRLAAASSELPKQAWAERVGVGEGIAGQVVAGGRALLVPEIANSAHAGRGRSSAGGAPGLMVVPVAVAGKVLGVINAAGRTHGGRFDEHHLALFQIVAGFVARTIQVVQLRKLLDSRFAQHALATHSVETATDRAFDPAYDADKMAKILAKSFFKEMTRAGFTPNHIIRAASEIISHVSSTVTKYKRRLDKRVR